MLLKFKLRRVTFTLVLACIFCNIGFTSVASAVDYRKLAFEMLDAAKEGNIEAVEALLEKKVPIESRNRFGNTALIYAVRGGHGVLVKNLVDAGASVNKSNLSGKTPLMEAAIKGNMGLARYLVEQKADVNAKTIENFNALIFATYLTLPWWGRFLLAINWSVFRRTVHTMQISALMHLVPCPSAVAWMKRAY